MMGPETLQDRKRRRRNDVILIATLLLVALIVFLLFSFCRKDGKTVVVTVDGEVIATYDLSETVTVELASGKEHQNRNVLVIRDGKAYIDEADCRDRICVNHAPIFREGDAIICLPNRVVISVE